MSAPGEWGYPEGCRMVGAFTCFVYQKPGGARWHWRVDIGRKSPRSTKGYKTEAEARRAAESALCGVLTLALAVL